MIIYGKQLFLHLLQNHPDQFEKIYLAKEIEREIFTKIVKLGVKIERVDTKKAQALARGGNHQGFLAEVKEYKFGEIQSLKDENFIVILYGLTDVGNIGAIARTLYALGGNSMVVVGANLHIEGVIRASSGAAYELNIIKTNDGLSLINELKQRGFSICGASAGNGKMEEKSEKIALIMGNEGDGIPGKVLKKCDQIVSIKMRENWDSLNVSAAFAIICDRILNG